MTWLARLGRKQCPEHTGENLLRLRLGLLAPREVRVRGDKKISKKVGDAFDPERLRVPWDREDVKQVRC